MPDTPSTTPTPAAPESPGEELRRVSAAVEEIRLLMRILVVLATVALIAALVAGIVAASTAGHVQQQLGIN